MKRWQIILVRMAILALVLGAWEIAPRMGFVNPMLLPPLSEVLAMLKTQIARPVVQEAIMITALEVIVAFIIAVPIGAAAGVAIAEFPYAGAIFKPMLFYVFSIPKSIFLPMFILIFGIGF
ncbi:MAG: ABC transporter permease, partial [Hyphomicrobium sp.]|nr:ABC transporter permease [Hyphomicrobium sp.]